MGRIVKRGGDTKKVVAAVLSAVTLAAGGVVGYKALNKDSNVYKPVDNENDIFNEKIPLLNQDGLVIDLVPLNSIIITNDNKKLKQNERVLVSAVNSEGNQVYGYIQSIYLKSSATVKSRKLKEFNIIYETNEEVQIKNKPSDKAENVTSLKPGTQILVNMGNSEDETKWQYCMYFTEDGKTKYGYIDEEKISIRGAVPTEISEANIRLSNSTPENLPNSIDSKNISDTDSQKPDNTIIEDNSNVEKKSEEIIKVRVNTENANKIPLNIRQGPGKEYEKIGAIDNGTELEIPIEKMAIVYLNNEKWISITYNGTSGYISTGYLEYNESKILEYIDGKIEPYEDVEITEEDIQKIKEFNDSWENQDLCRYIKRINPDKYESSNYINRFITKDGSQYICYTDINDTRNYGFGVMINEAGNPNYQTLQYFEKLGYDLTDPKYLQVGISTLPVDVVDKVSQMYVKDSVETIKSCLKDRNIKFTKQQIMALATISYQFGRDKQTISWLIDTYIKSLGNPELYRENLVTSHNTYILKEVLGGNVYYEGKKINRGEAYYSAFKDGKLIFGISEEQPYDINNEEKSKNTNIKNTQKVSYSKGVKRNRFIDSLCPQPLNRNEQRDKRQQGKRISEEAYLKGSQYRRKGGFSI